jgi:predicted N-acetyltransferase YhbS
MAGPEDHGLIFRQGYFGDPAGWAALVDLLQNIFSIDVGMLDQFGGPDQSSMPFAYFDEAGTCIANFSVFSMPVVIDGKEVEAAGFQSGAVRPEWRGRGLYRDLMRREFAWTETQGFELGLLLTSKPALYEPYGFQIVPQHSFAGTAPADLPNATPAINLALPADGAAIKSLLVRRVPVSQRFAVTQQVEMFLLNGCFDPEIRLSRLQAYEAVVAWKLEGGCLKLLDVVGQTMPPLAAIIASLGVRPDRIEVYFPTDQLDWKGIATPHQGHTVLMMRGPAAARISGPIMLSPMAEF